MHAARRKRRCAAAVDSALELGKGVVHALAPTGESEVFSSAPRLPRLRSRLSRARSAAAVVQFQPGMVRAVLRHSACGSRASSADQTGEEAAVVGERARVRATARRRRPARSCHGARLNPVALHLRFHERSIAELTALSVIELRAVLAQLRLARARARSRAMRSRRSTAGSGFLERVGLGYLALDRAAPSLSGGEAQRIRLAAQLGSNLQGVCYVLDEPTIGLHPRDNAVLLDALDQLGGGRQHSGGGRARRGHDPARRSHHRSGTRRRRARRTAWSPPAAPQSPAAQSATRSPDVSSRDRCVHPATPRRATNGRSAALEIEAAELHNLRDIDVRIPLGRLVVVTGVSGLRQVIAGARRALRQPARAWWERRGRARRWSAPGRCAAPSRSIGCSRSIRRRSAARRAPVPPPMSASGTISAACSPAPARRACAATTPSRFSFNTGGGRCPDCEGAGIRTIEMSFLPDVKVLCERCGGKRFDRETLEVQWRGRSVGDVLAMNVEEAAEFFAAHPRIARPLHTARRRWPGLSDARATEPDTLGRRSPAHQAGRRSWRASRESPRATAGAHALCAR